MGKKVLVVKTSLNDVEIDPEEQLQVFIDNGVSVIKKAGDLSRGDRVLINNDSISVNQQEALDLLERNPVYRYARGKIYHVYEPNRRITLLRKLLLEGLIAKGLIPNTPEMRDAIVMKARDLTNPEKSKARASIEILLDQEQKHPTNTTVLKWIQNDGTVLPYSEYRSALTVINPELDTFSDRDVSEGSRYRAYTFWRSCREMLIARLSRRNGNSKTNGNGHELDEEGKTERPTVSMVVSDIVDEVAKSYDGQSSIASVVSVRADECRGERTPANPNALRKRGNEQPLTLRQILEDCRILQTYSSLLLAQYFRSIKVKEDEIIPLQDAVYLEFMKSYGTISASFKSRINAKEKRPSQQMIDRILNDLMENKPDKEYGGVDEGTTRRFISIDARLQQMVPEDIQKWYSLCEEMENIQNDVSSGRLSDARIRGLREQAEEIIKQEARLKKRILEKYHEDPTDLFRRSTVWDIVNLHDTDILSETDPDKMKARILEVAEKHNYKLFTKQEIEATLTRYGLEKFIALNGANLLLDSNGIVKAICEINTDDNRIQKYGPPNHWREKATKEHNALVESVLRAKFLGQLGLQVQNAEYNFESGWARADILCTDRNNRVVGIEVKQYATTRDAFDNASKAIQQTLGYKAALEGEVSMRAEKCQRCPGVQAMNREYPVRGMLVAYEIDDAAKKVLTEHGCEYIIIDRETRQIKEGRIMTDKTEYEQLSQDAEPVNGVFNRQSSRIRQLKVIEPSDDRIMV